MQLQQSYSILRYVDIRSGGSYDHLSICRIRSAPGCPRDRRFDLAHPSQSGLDRSHSNSNLDTHENGVRRSISNRVWRCERQPFDAGVGQLCPDVCARELPAWDVGITGSGLSALNGRIQARRAWMYSRRVMPGRKARSHIAKPVRAVPAEATLGAWHPDCGSISASAPATAQVTDLAHLARCATATAGIPENLLSQSLHMLAYGNRDRAV